MSISEDLFINLEKPVSYVFQAMENRGVRIDVPYLEKLKGELEAQLEPIKEAIYNELGPLNLDSPKQLLEALNEKGIEPIFKGKSSTDKRALDALRHLPVVQSLLSYSEVQTLLTSFVFKYLEREVEVVHPYFNQCGTRTGRVSCSNPNLLQIPRRTENGKKVRKMFIPRDGNAMGDCDFGQIEPRVMGHLSKDPTLLELFNRGTDFHSFTAERLSIDRDRAKVLNLSVGYRATFKSVSTQLKCSEYDAKKEIEKWWSLFPAMRRWEDRLIWESRKSGYCTTLMGRRIKVEGLEDPNKYRREHAERQLINNIVQGSAAEIMKASMISIARNFPRIGLLAQVYDELLFESPKKDIDRDMKVVVVSMVNAVKLDVPLTVDSGIGANWEEAKN